MAIGPVVRDVSDDFDRYWASDSAFPAGRLLPPPEAGLRALGRAVERARADMRHYLEAVRASPYVRQLVEGTLPLEWAETRMVSDDPAKGLGLSSPADGITARLKDVFGEPHRSLDLVSPYLVPTSAGVAWFVGMAERGVRVRILTNSLEATDAAIVHAGYAKHRRALLEADVVLYEARSQAMVGRPQAASAGVGSSATSLHAKTFAVDGSRVFVGSLNFDPRSAHLNTELGFVIDSPGIAQAIASTFDTRVPQNAFEVRLSDNGQVYWLARQQGTERRLDAEPGAGVWRRASVWIFERLPIDWLL
jgi:putative cardiolipin synthase